MDFGLLDTVSNAALLCELKWFAAADSSKEVYAREDEITHGCEQSESIMAYAMSDRKQFITQVFDIDDGDNIDLFCCVVAMHNIRTQHKYVSVIDLKKFKELFLSQPINSVFHTIRKSFFSAYKLHRLYAEAVHSRLVFFRESVGFWERRKEQVFTEHMLDKHLFGHGDMTTCF